MKIQSSLPVIGRIRWAIIICLGLHGCTQPVTSPPQGNPSVTISQFVATGTNTTIFEDLCSRTGFDTILKQTGPFTAFIAPDAGFSTLGIDQSWIDSTPDSVLKSLVAYQIIDGEALGSNNLPAGPNAKVVTSGGDSVFITNTGTQIFINGVPVEEANIGASNGLIHAVLLPLIPPKGSLLQSLQLDSNFSYMAAAITRASQGSTNLDSILAGGPYTVFVPTNTAFQSAGYPSLAAINSANPDSLARILVYHIVSGRLFTSDFAQNIQVTSLGGAIFDVLTGSPAQVKGNNSAFGNVVQANLMAQNGVIQLIGTVMIP
jgi:uncharacterized surface protein with fasciclin (FAS1) repeats